MKCVCPMGGDRTCPNDCPLAVWTNLSPKDRKAQRKPIAEKLYKQRFTMEAIATQLGVHHSQIVRDLQEFVHDAQTQPRTSKRGRKNEGRPKGKRNARAPKAIAREEQVELLEKAGLSAQQIANEVGLGVRAVHQALEHVNIKREAEPTIDPSTLSLTAQQKLDMAIRQHERKLDLEFEVRCRNDCMRWLNEVSLPQYLKEITALERSISNRKGIMDRITYRKILSCLHPDRVADAGLKKRYEEAFRLFTELEKRVLDEKESPTQFRPMPRTYEELMAMKAKVQAERKAKRHAKQAVRPR